MAITKISPGVYRVRARGLPHPKTGKRKYRSRIVHGNLSAAKLVEAELSRMGESDRAEMTFAEVAGEWLGSRSLEENTVSYYKRGLSDLEPISDHLADRVDTMDCERVLESLKPGYGRRRARKVLSAVMSYALKHGYITDNPMVRNTVSDGMGKPKRETFTPEEMSRILELYHGHPHEPVILLMCMGIRRGEACAMRYEDIDLVRGIAHVRRSVVDVNGRRVEKSTKTAGSVRDVPLSGYILERFREIDGKGPVCTINPHSVSDRFRKRLEAAGIPYRRLYSLRHSFASLLVSGGAPLSAVQSLLGHSRLTQTAQYVMTIGSDAENAVKQAAELLKPKV